jgi:predicted porin
VEEASNSRLGFRGSEDLGNGLKAIFQLEMTVAIDTGAASNGQLFNRDTYLGLSSKSFGKVRLGNMDTVYKSVGDTLSFLGISSGNFISDSNVLSKPGLGTNSASSFHLRRANSVIYDSPKFAGFQAHLDWSFGEQTTNFRYQSGSSNGITYENGPIYLALANEIHTNLFGASRNIAASVANLTAGNPTPGVSSKDTATRFTAQYKFTPDTRAEVNVAQLKYKEDGAAVGKFSEYKTNTWAIGAEHKIGAYTLVGSYGQTGAGDCSLVGGAACNTTGLDAKMLNLGVGYSMSKRTMLYLIASELRNGASSRSSNVGDAPKPTFGQDITQVAVGIRHDF